MKKNMAIVLGATKDYFFAVGTVVMGIKQFSPQLADDIIIFYDDVSDIDKDILVNQLGCTLVRYSLPFNLDSLNPPSCWKRFTPLVLSIYEIFKLLNGYHNVLWLDGDVCIQGDISEIVNYGPFGIRFGGTLFEDALGRKVHPDIDATGTSNTGVVFVNDSLEGFNDLYKQCYHYTQRFIQTLSLPDQGIINYVLWKNNIKAKNLTEKFNYTVYHPIYGYEQSLIFHIAHDCKFWNHSILNGLFPLWQKQHQKWLELGGSSYQKKHYYTGTKGVLSMRELIDIIMAASENAYSELIAQKIVINEQDKQIKKFEENVKELLDILQLKNK